MTSFRFFARLAVILLIAATSAPHAAAVTGAPASSADRVGTTVAEPPPRLVRALPRGSVVVRHRGVSYYSYRGTYYRRVRGGFIVVAPPAGLVVSALPRGAVTVRMHGQRLYRHAGVYYRPVRGGYLVVRL